MKDNNTQNWTVLQIRNAYTGKWRWGVCLIGGVTHIPQSYGVRAALRLRNRLEKETQKALKQEYLKKQKAIAC